MKRKFIAIAAVLTFGIGGAVVANQLTDPAPNVMNTAPEGQPPHWEPLTDQNGCDDLTPRECIGYEAFPGATVTNVQYGNKL